MKASILLFFSVLPFSRLQAQNFETLRLKYAMTQKVFNANENGQLILVGKQEKIGNYIKKFNQYLFYVTPVDTVSVTTLQIGAGSQATVNFMTDSLQQVQYRNTDSMFNLVMISRSGQRRVNRFDLFKAEQKWEILNETKKIGTFDCQKAIWKDEGFLVAEIWFAPGIPVYYGLQNYNEVPGMIVEATQFYPHIEYKLIEYVADAEVNDDEIFPAYLRVSPNYMSRESYEQNLKRLRTLRKTQGRIN